MSDWMNLSGRRFNDYTEWDFDHEIVFKQETDMFKRLVFVHTTNTKGIFESYSVMAEHWLIKKVICYLKIVFPQIWRIIICQLC